MKLRCGRDELKGHTLKLIVTRIDYQDIFEISDSTLKEIQVSLSEMLDQRTDKLDINDFYFNDPTNILHLTEDYIRSVENQIFILAEDLILEVNSLFMRIIQNPEDKYRNYKETLDIADKLIDILLKKENVRIRRVSIKKVNEVIFKDLDDLKEHYNSDIINLSQYHGFINWSLPQSKSKLVQNFMLNESVPVNFVRIFGNGLIQEEPDPVFRLYTEFEAYEYFLKSKFNAKTSDLLTFLNENIFILFEGSLTDIALEKLKNNIKLGDY
jgi:hypothetical protein